jgi:hypothetical protein
MWETLWNIAHPNQTQFLKNINEFSNVILFQYRRQSCIWINVDSPTIIVDFP